MKFFSIIKKIIAVGILSVFIFSIFGTIAYAVGGAPCEDGKAADGGYCSLTTIPGAFDPEVSVNPISVIKNIYGISIGIGAILAVVMIIWAGVEYSTTEAITGKSDAKERWQGALFGLILLLASYIILRTINVDLVNLNLDLGSPVKCEILEKGKKVPCKGIDPGALNEAIEVMQKQSQQFLQDIEKQEKNAEEAQRNLDEAKKQNDPLKIIAAEQTLENIKNNATVSSVQKNNAIDSAVEATKAFIPQGVEDSLRSKFDESVSLIDNAINRDLEELRKKERAATNSVTKKIIGESIKNLSDKKLMVDTSLDASWRTASNLKYAATQKDSLSSFQQSLINQKNLVLSKVTSRRSSDAINFQKTMNKLILDVGNQISAIK